MYIVYALFASRRFHTLIYLFLDSHCRDDICLFFRELEKEIAMMNTESFKWGVNWQQVLKSLIEDHQDIEDPEAKKVSLSLRYHPIQC